MDGDRRALLHVDDVKPDASDGTSHVLGDFVKVLAFSPQLASPAFVLLGHPLATDIRGAMSISFGQ